MNNQKLFYRVLYTEENKAAWRNADYHSGHRSPDDWFQIWKETRSINASDYPQECSTGYYSERARNSFLKAASEGRVDALSESEAKAICEQDGVFAYESPQQALDYLVPESPARRRHSDRYVEFIGEVIAQDKVEGKNALIVRVIHATGEMLTREEFIQRQHL